MSSHIILHPPHFFTVVLQLNIRHKKLMIPVGFVKDYGKFLSSSVKLKIPDNKEWKIGLTTSTNGTVWLQNGWHEFAEYYGLEFGSFLVFRFDGNSTFHTTIFDMNGSEIKYTSNLDDSGGDFEEEDDDDDSDEKIDIFSQESKKRNNNNDSLPSFQSLKKMRNQDSFLAKMEPQEEDGCNISRVSMKRQPLTNKADEKPGFKVVMKQSNVGGRFDMIIPKEFAGKYLSKEFEMIRLQNSNGRTWSLVYKWNRNQGKNFAYISSGWKGFAEENLLKEGDVLFFQLIKKDQFLFTKLQHTSLSPSPSSPNNKTTTARKNPSFQVDIHSTNYKNPILQIPKSFATKHLSPEMHTAKLRVGNKQWTVKLKQYDDRFRLSAGWATFYKENCLKDTSCLFEMVNKKDCVFKVTIFTNVSSTTSDSETEEED